MIPKFRAWDKRTGTVQEIELISFKEKKVVIEQKSVTWFNSEYVRRFDEVELIRSTGLKDKNELDIFEGDAVRGVFPNGKCFRGVVKYDNERAEFVCETTDRWLPSSMSVCRNCEVIGNIYENPELMEGE